MRGSCKLYKMSGFSTKEVNVRSRYTCIRSPPNLANRSLLQRNPTILRLLLSKIALRPPWSPPPPWSSAALAAAMIPAMDSSGELFLWRSVSGRFRFNWSQGDLRPPWTPASARVRPPSTRRYRDPIRSRSSRWLQSDLRSLPSRYRLQLLHKTYSHTTSTNHNASCTLVVFSILAKYFT